MFITSAPSRLPASSKDACVRVEASKNRLIWVRPRSVDFLLLDLPGHVDGLVRHVQQREDVPRRQPFDAEKVAVREALAARASAH